MKKSYKEYIRFNKNLIISFAVSTTISATVAQSLSFEQSYVNSSYTTAVDFVSFYSTFAALFYLDNKKKYKQDFGAQNKNLKKDLLKLISSLGAGEAVYLTSRWFLQYYFLLQNQEPYVSSITSQAISTVIYLGVVNLGVKITRLFKDVP